MILALPAVALFAVFTAWPIGELLLLSMQRTDFTAREWVGLANYTALATDAAFLRAMANSAAYVVLLVAGQVGLALLLALLAWDAPPKWRSFARIAFYVPTLAAGAISAQSWRWVFSHGGPANWLLSMLGVAPVAWFSDAVPAIPVLAVILSLSVAGLYLVMLLAASASIDKGILEAARMDGASRRVVTTRIVLPSLMPTVALCATLAAIAAPQVFETVSFLAPYEHAATLAFAAYSEAFRFSRHGSAASMAVVLFVLTAVLTAVKERVARAE